MFRLETSHVFFDHPRQNYIKESSTQYFFVFKNHLTNLHYFFIGKYNNSLLNEEAISTWQLDMFNSKIFCIFRYQANGHGTMRRHPWCCHSHFHKCYH